MYDTIFNMHVIEVASATLGIDAKSSW